MQRLFIIGYFFVAFFLTACDGSKGNFVSDGEARTTEILEIDKACTDTEAAGKNDPGGQVAVYVCGAVNSPGVYYLFPESIKEDALLAAGGLLPEASKSYVNLAEQISPGEKIYFPWEDELEPELYIDTGTKSDGRININKATAEELMTLSGIGQSKADSIIEYREEHGRFSCVEDIMNIPGIKEGVFNSIKDCIVVD